MKYAHGFDVFCFTVVTHQFLVVGRGIYLPISFGITLLTIGKLHCASEEIVNDMGKVCYFLTATERNNQSTVCKMIPVPPFTDMV